MADDVASLEDLLRAVRVNVELFDALGGISEAFAQMPLADVGTDSGRAERTRRITGQLRAQMPSVPEPDATEIAVVLRHLLSHRSWFWLSREYGLTTEQVAQVVTWAIATLTDAAEGGNLPSRMEEP